MECSNCNAICEPESNRDHRSAGTPRTGGARGPPAAWWGGRSPGRRGCGRQGPPARRTEPCSWPQAGVAAEGGTGEDEHVVLEPHAPLVHDVDDAVGVAVVHASQEYDLGLVVLGQARDERLGDVAVEGEEHDRDSTRSARHPPGEGEKLDCPRRRVVGQRPVLIKLRITPVARPSTHTRAVVGSDRDW